MGGKFWENISIVYGRNEFQFPANDNEDRSDAFSTTFSRPGSLSCQS